MDMMLVLGILASIFFISLTLICLYHDSINTKIFNAVFVALDVIFYFVWNLGMYERGWLNDGFETFGNISPFIFTVIPLTYLMHPKVKEYAFSAIALLWLGMFVALFISPEYAYIYDYHRQASVLYTGEALCHMLASLFGIYLIITKQVKLNLQTWIRAIVFMYSGIFFGVFLNYFFHKAHFGMNPYGNFSIYFLDIFGTFEATFIAYLFGVLTVLTVGMQLAMLFKYLIEPKKVKTQHLHTLAEEGELEIIEADVVREETPTETTGE